MDPVQALARALFTGIVLVVLYYALPLTAIGNASTVTLLVAGLALVLLLIVYEIRTIIRSDYSAIRAIEALAMITPLFLLLFSVAYYLMEHAVPASFGQHLTRTEALYFTITTFSTVGYGDMFQ